MAFRCYYVEQVPFDHEIVGHPIRLRYGPRDGSGVRLLRDARSARGCGLDAETAGNPRIGRAQRYSVQGEPAQAGVYRAPAPEPAGAGTGDPPAVEAGQTQRKSLHEAARRIESAGSGAKRGGIPRFPKSPNHGRASSLRGVPEFWSPVEARGQKTSASNSSFARTESKTARD